MTPLPGPRPRPYRRLPTAAVRASPCPGPWKIHMDSAMVSHMAKDSYPYKLPMAFSEATRDELELIAKARNATKTALIREYVTTGLRRDLDALRAIQSMQARANRSGGQDG